MTKYYRLTFHILLGMVLVLAILSGGETLYYFAIVLGTVKLGAYFLVKHHQKNIFVLYYTSENIVETGDSIEVEYKVSNTSMVPVAHSLIEFKLDNKMNVAGKLKEMAFFASQERINFTKNIKCVHRGYYKIGQVSVDVFDPLFLDQRSVFFDKEIDVTVHPKIIPLHGLAFHPKVLYGTLKSNRKTLEDRTNIVNIRKYEQGDQMKNIHWKLSAKKDTLMTKEFEQTVSAKLMILVDGYRGHFDRGYTMDQEEYLVSFVASLSKEILDQGMQLKLALNDNENTVIETTSRSDFAKVLDALTQFQSNSDRAFETFIRQYETDHGEDESFVLITPRMTGALLEQIDRQGTSAGIFTFSGGKFQTHHVKAQFIDEILGVTHHA